MTAFSPKYKMRRGFLLPKGDKPVSEAKTKPVAHSPRTGGGAYVTRERRMGLNTKTNGVGYAENDKARAAKKGDENADKMTDGR